MDAVDGAVDLLLSIEGSRLSIPAITSLVRITKGLIDAIKQTADLLAPTFSKCADAVGKIIGVVVGFAASAVTGNGAFLNLKGFPTPYAVRPTAASASVYPKRTRSSSFKACEQNTTSVKLPIHAEN